MWSETIIIIVTVIVIESTNLFEWYWMTDDYYLRKNKVNWKKWYFGEQKLPIQKSGIPQKMLKKTLISLF